MKNFGLGAFESPKDKRTVKANALTLSGTPLVKGGFDFTPEDILNQSKVGICCAISLIQNRNKANGKKYSADFQYLLMKKYYDLNWIEGSSIMSALKVGKKFGFLPESKWKHTTLKDRDLSYGKYIAKLQAIPDKEIERLLKLCVDNIGGYASVIIQPQDIAKAIENSEAGLLARYEVGNEWFTSESGKSSWKEKDISPLRPPKTIISGHAIIKSAYDYTKDNRTTLANTWSDKWCRGGCADVLWDNYVPTELWLITKEPVINRFDTNLYIGCKGDAVVNLQNALKIKGFFNYESTGYYGLITWNAVRLYQKTNEIKQTGNCYELTRGQLNKDFNL